MKNLILYIILVTQFALTIQTVCANGTDLFYEMKSDLGFKIKLFAKANDLNREDLYKRIFLDASRGSFQVLSTEWDLKETDIKIGDVIEATDVVYREYLNQSYTKKNHIPKLFSNEKGLKSRISPKVQEKLDVVSNKTIDHSTYLNSQTEQAELKYWKTLLLTIENHYDSKDSYLKLRSLMESIELLANDNIRLELLKQANLLKEKFYTSNLDGILKDQSVFKSDLLSFQDLIILSLIENRFQKKMSAEEFDDFLFNLFMYGFLFEDKENLYLKGIFFIKKGALKLFSEKLNEKIKKNEILKMIKNSDDSLKRKICDGIYFNLKFSCERKVMSFFSQSI